MREREKERERDSVCVCESVRESESERERERERDLFGHMILLECELAVERGKAVGWNHTTLMNQPTLHIVKAILTQNLIH